MPSGIFPSSNLPSPLSPQLQTCVSWLEAITTADFDSLERLVTDDYTHTFLPPELNSTKLIGKKMFLEFFRGELKDFASFGMTINEVEETPGEVVWQLSSDTMTTGGYHYTNEYTVVISVSKQVDGTHQVAGVRETFKHPELLAALQRAIAGQKV
ncbi:hypothetical protein EIP91_000861 [Steccherinum ochraceum]|uniref:SnoaL-like domain-containing protein n=1 Tax=Steccherinum ochraceum TaxID=92696 RepID=A0A4R0S315_9APHY|nr:hypothetical protein EIP91_000861 [Steccherinum ochraceum]